MTKFKFNRRRLRNGVLFGAPLALSVQCDAPDEEPTYTQDLAVNLESDGPFIEAINACIDDRDACIELCDQILVDQGYATSPGELEIFECNVTKRPTSVDVEMTFESYPIGVGCGVVTVTPDAEHTSLGSHFAAVAELEARSVYAFIELARDLRGNNAPVELVAAAVRAASDEVRHAHQAAAVARAWGTSPREVGPGEHAERDLFALCVENTVDGCIHETFGAEVASHQAVAAADPFVRSVMQSIARDEQRHAELAQAIDRWARPQLSGDQRRALETVARVAAHELLVSQKDAPPTVAEIAGFPSAEEARSLVRRIEAKRRARWA